MTFYYPARLEKQCFTKLNLNLPSLFELLSEYILRQVWKDTQSETKHTQHVQTGKKNNVSAPTTAVQNKDEEKGIVESTKQEPSRQRGCSFCLFIQFVFATENQHTCAILQRSRMPRKERMLMVSSSGMLVKKP